MQASDPGTPGELPPGLPTLHAADLAEMPPPPLTLDPAGRPVDPLLVVDAGEFAELPPPVRSRAVAALRGSRRATVAVARGTDRIPGDLAQAVDLGLTAAPGAADARTVAVPHLGEALDSLAERFAATPLAALTYVWLLRQSAGLPVPAALSAESAAYSTLLAGPEFARWLAARGPAREPDDRTHRVVCTRVGDVLHVRLDRPARRNAVDAAMRDALVAALTPAEWDPNLLVEITGAGPAFSAGGDLDEFGSAPDPARAHVVRLGAGVAEVVHRIRDRVTMRVHGTCLGAGFELPCFAGRVLAAPDTRLGLPELAMGLIPGAGGTVSIVRRAGRWRAAWLGLSGTRVDAGTAHAWGLVDEVLDAAPAPVDGAEQSGTQAR
ncbi:enoyl-CoA hydratase/isomerase family protein [Trujillonella endophytica]|uniref:Enoyl-CoA hydratase/carnithine racemase n=1 Tax=Trujillonella endophytica TaxID=673521 RepID=A0A1H8W8E6_9ACTN|nr:enoyl-CoA hydratase/isomerase family protein [Trujillella endophytica]SEP23687.1 Enoyl-CoA hydratase/carnithine racemase [Trujillella endophytica]